MPRRRRIAPSARSRLAGIPVRRGSAAATEGRRVPHEGHAGIEVVDDVVLHPHRQDVAQAAAEAAGVLVAAQFLGRMMRRPAEEEPDVDPADDARQPPDQSHLERVTCPGESKEHRIEGELAHESRGAGRLASSVPIRASAAP